MLVLSLENIGLLDKQLVELDYWLKELSEASDISKIAFVLICNKFDLFINDQEGQKGLRRI